MTKWPIPVLLCLALCACQVGPGAAVPRAAEEPCPQLSPCDDPDDESWLLPGRFSGAVATLADYHPMFSTCPQTLQVKASGGVALRHPVVFKAVRPDENSDTETDQGEWACGAPDAPLQRVDRQRGGGVAFR
jgi:hypothetical protein